MKKLGKDLPVVFFTPDDLWTLQFIQAILANWNYEAIAKADGVSNIDGLREHISDSVKLMMRLFAIADDWWTCNDQGCVCGQCDNLYGNA
jgi:hypothetical protein